VLVKNIVELASGSAGFYLKKMRKRSSLNQILKLLLFLSFASFSGETDTNSKRRHHRNPEGRSHQRKSDNSGLSSNSMDLKSSSSPSVFLTSNNTEVMAHIGSTTTLNCQVIKDSQYGVITWARLPELSSPYTVLTIGDTKYISNDRFAIEKPIRHEKWNLRIRSVELEDAGMYECQATTHPPQSIFVNLRVVAAYAEIVGTKDKVFNSGSPLQLVCVLTLATSKPDYIFWYHNDRMINFDTERGIAVKEDETGSTLTINNVSVDDSGNYSCQPRDMRPDSVVVTILSEKQAPDALQDKTTHTSLASRQAPWAGLLLMVTVIYLSSS